MFWMLCEAGASHSEIAREVGLDAERSGGCLAEAEQRRQRAEAKANRIEEEPAELKKRHGH